VIIRDALDADLPQIVEIVNAYLPTTTAEWRETEYTLQDRGEWLAQHRRAGDPVLVAEVDGEVAGFSCYADFRDSQKWPGYRFVVENTIHVREAHWDKGVGRALIEALLERAAVAGKRVMVAAVDAENVRSVRFHERCGFVEVARMPGIGFKLGRWLTLVLLQRQVDLLSGVWTLDLARSAFSTPSPQNWELLVEADGFGMSVEERIARADGSISRVSFAPRFDGRDYPVTGSPLFDSVSFVKRDSHRLEATGKKAGAVTMKDTTEVSRDGRALTIEYVILDGPRTIGSGRAVFDRASNS
jgi:L-amino acid N-acyltransferase YncA